MPKAKKVEHDKVFVSFHCPEADCDDSARVDINFLIECGTPVCPACDCDMEKTYSYAEVEA